MKELSKDWLIEKHIDAEYKRYVLMAYLKEISNNFDRNILYPFLADLIEHYKDLVRLKKDTDALYNNFPGELKKLNLEKYRLLYERLYDDEDLIEELKEIINYSIPQFEAHLKEGKDIYDFIEQKLHILPVGVVPLYDSEGYMLLRNGLQRDTMVYQYHITVFEKSDEKFKAIRTTYITSYERNISTTYEYMKSTLIRQNKELPNPATFAVESELEVPVQETLLPIAKRSLVEYVSTRG